MVRVPPDLLKPLDQWIKDQPKPRPSRPEAVRLALNDWLTGLGLVNIGARPSAANVAESAQIASQTIDDIQDPAAPPAEQAKRKRQLLKGPREFREVRDNSPKPRGRRR
jgi:hypothetical protein